MGKSRKKRKTQHKKPQNKHKSNPSKKTQNTKQSNTFLTKLENNKFIIRLLNRGKKSKSKESVKPLDWLMNCFRKNKKEILFFSGMAVVALGMYVVIRMPKPAEEEAQEPVTLDMSEYQTPSLLDSEDDLDLMNESEEEKETEEILLSDEEVRDQIDAVNNVDPTAMALTEGEVVDKVYEGVVMAQKEALLSVEEAMMVAYDSYGLFVNNEPVAYFRTKTEADGFIETLKDEFRTEGAIEERIIFAEDVQIKRVKNDVLNFEGYMDQEAIMELVKKGTNEQKFHQVVKGDNLWDIAEKYGMNPLDLIEAHKDIDEYKMQPGDMISLILPMPLINVVTITTIERIDAIQYGREADIDNPDIYVGKRVVKVKGVPGEARNLVEVHTENGNFVGELIIESEVLKEPINAVYYAGTKPAPPAFGSGVFANPTSRGYITSYFGPRGSSYHYGLDIGVGMHTPIYASDGGQVIFSGYYGTYGKLVIIDHGANKKTYYAHNDVLLVSAGETVAKGDKIALSGSTGRSTGPHLHFEIRVNDSPVNPLRYVKYY